MKNGRADPLPFAINALLLLVDGLFEFGPWGEFRDLAGGNLNRGARLRVAAVAGFSSRHREGAETDQGNALAFSQGSGDAVDGRINGGSGRGFTDSRAGCNLVNEIAFVHCFSWQVRRSPASRGGTVRRTLKWEPGGSYFPPLAPNVNCENPHRKPSLHWHGAESGIRGGF